MSDVKSGHRHCFNIASRLADRQIFGHPPGSQVACCRHWYENIVPNEKIEVEAPDFHICRFLPSGRLVGFSKMLRELSILSYKDCTAHKIQDDASHADIPFSRFFKTDLQLLIAGSEHLCKDFCLVAHGEQYLIVASCSTPIPSPAQPGHNPALPLVASTVIYVVNSVSGVICATYRITDDFIQLSHAHNVFLLEDRLCILAVRSQSIHILRLNEAGGLALIHKLGTHCSDDDGLTIERYNLAEQAWLQQQVDHEISARQLSQDAGISSPPIVPQNEMLISHHTEHTQLDRNIPWDGMIVGIRQRLLTHIFLHKLPPSQFFRHFDELSGLIMWKVQFLDKKHLLISMGSQDAWLQRDSGTPVAQSYGIILWSLEQASILQVWNYDSSQLLEAFQLHWQFFHTGCIFTPWHTFLTPPSPCMEPLPLDLPQTAIRRILSNLPTTSQSQTPSPYLDNRIYQYDDKVISALQRPRPCTEAPLKFSTRAFPGAQSFRIQVAPEPSSNTNERTTNRYIVHYHFHPWLPLVLCLLQRPNAPERLTIFYRGHQSR